MAVLIASYATVSPALPPQGLSHTPWWHARGHLSDYATCQPAAEDDAFASLASLTGEQQHSRARPVKVAQYREEFLNVASEVPELAAIFVPEDVRPELLPPGRPGRLPLGLHADSLHHRLNELYRQRTSWRGAESALEDEGEPSSLGYQMMRIWLDEAYGDLGGARGRYVVQRGMSDPCRFAAPAGGLTEENEPAHFFLPDFLCLELPFNLSLASEPSPRSCAAAGVDDALQGEMAHTKEAERQAHDKHRKNKHAAPRKARKKVAPAANG